MKTILIVDDNKDLADVYSIKLKSEGFNIVSISEPEEGLRQAQKTKPDLILLDVVMPKLSGYNFFLKLKENAKTKDIKVIFMTAYNDPAPWGQVADRQYALKIGAQGFLRKEISLDNFVSEIKKVLLE
jgi:CheY-like chemotaxis protein